MDRLIARGAFGRITSGVAQYSTSSTVFPNGGPLQEVLGIDRALPGWENPSASPAALDTGKR
ncbi:MAG: hypothetical protein M1118_14805 [Chloroflexi bacterium]|nr:hypothetical protein [Chloroflexota bacterium]